MSECYHLTIIGMGVSGSAFLRELACSLPNRSNIAITVITDDCLLDEYGSYGRDIDQARLNRNIDNMSDAFQSADCDFYHWLKRFQTDIKLTDEVSRYLYGNYLVEQISQSSVVFFDKEINFSIVKQTVKEIAQSHSKLQLICSDDSSIFCDRVVVAIGPQRKKDPYNLKNYSNYLDSAYPLSNLISSIESKTSVGILGSSLSAVEAALAICKEKDDALVYLCSRSNELPTVRDASFTTKPTIFNFEEISTIPSMKSHDIRCLLDDELALFDTSYESIMAEDGLSDADLFNRAIKNVELGKVKWKSVIQSLNLTFNKSFLMLSKQEKNNFRNTFNERWMKHRISISLSDAKELMKFIDKGKIKIASLDSIIPNPPHFRFVTRTGETFDVSTVVNATGHQRDLRNSNSALLKNLIDSGILSLDEGGRGYVFPESCEAIPSEDKQRLPVHILGAASEGTYFFTGAVDVLSHQAKTAAKSIFNILKNLPEGIL